MQKIKEKNGVSTQGTNTFSTTMGTHPKGTKYDTCQQVSTLLLASLMQFCELIQY